MAIRSHRLGELPPGDHRREERRIELRTERRSIMVEALHPAMWMPPMVALASAWMWTFGGTVHLRRVGFMVFVVAGVSTLFLVGQVAKDLAMVSWEIHQLRDQPRVVEPDGSAVYRSRAAESVARHTRWWR